MGVEGGGAGFAQDVTPRLRGSERVNQHWVTRSLLVLYQFDFELRFWVLVEIRLKAGGGSVHSAVRNAGTAYVGPW